MYISRNERVKSKIAPGKALTAMAVLLFAVFVVGVVIVMVVALDKASGFRGGEGAKCRRLENKKREGKAILGLLPGSQQ